MIKKALVLLSLTFIVSLSILLYIPTTQKSRIDFIIIVKHGQNSTNISEQLRQKGVISSPKIFHLAYKIKNLLSSEKRLKAGGFKIEKGMNYYEIIDLLSSNKYYTLSVTFPEGLTKIQMFEILNKTNSSGEISIDAKEGELMPETYVYNLLETKNDIIKRMKKDMSELLDDAWSKNENKMLKTKEDLLIFASIVEKETNNDDEFGLVASVFTNRLEKGMKLQSDPTIIYEATNGATNFGRSITKKDIKTGKDYNTYIIYGLPKGPICSPSKKAILASINPTKTDYLYFVAIGDGSKKHRFTKTYDAHLVCVNEYRKNCLKKELGGDSFVQN